MGHIWACCVALQERGSQLDNVQTLNDDWLQQQAAHAGTTSAARLFAASTNNWKPLLHA